MRDMSRNNRKYLFTAIMIVLLLAMVPALVLAQMSHKGLVESMPGGGTLTGTWEIGGMTFTADDNTTFDLDKGPLAVGVCAEVEYVMQGGDNLATKIASKSADDCAGEPQFHHTGLVQEKPAGGTEGDWAIGGMTFRATASTQFDETNGPLDVGVCAEVEYSVSGMHNVANKIASKNAGDCAGGDDRQSADGTIDSMPGDGLLGTWTISGVDYLATTTTHFEQSDGPFEPGACVEVEFVVQNGLNIAIKIETEHHCGGGTLHPDVQKATGILNAFPSTTMTGTWTISGVDYLATEATEFDQNHGAFAVGVCVKVKYVMVNTTRQALEIETESPDDCGQPGQSGEAELTGAIEVMPSGTLTGTWVIAGQSFTATLQTRFEQEHGQFEVGRCVEVEYLLNGHIATKIKTKGEHDCRGETEESEAHGFITALPGGGTLVLTGTWTIGGLDYLVTTDTKLEHGPFYVGLLVEVKFYRRSDGVLVATKIEGKQQVDEEDKHTAKAYGLIEARPMTGTLGSIVLTGTWTIGGVDYEATAETKFEAEHGPFDLGACVKVRYRVEGTTNIALKIETKKAEECQDEHGEHSNRGFGFVESAPPQGVIGTWIIGGVEYEITAQTKIKEEHGALGVGAYVKVKYRLEGGVRMVHEIETHVPPEAGSVDDIGSLHLGGGALRTTGTLTQTWTIGGVDYQIIDATLLDDSQAPFANGQLVTVNAYPWRGELIATRVNALQTQSLYLPLVLR
ncbi:MAG: hypothetical protein D6796_07230 [Caldilineae bacterium]|nr:MAG: hypothetical protein D6796_07230 [Caldilineae bacterium]